MFGLDVHVADKRKAGKSGSFEELLEAAAIERLAKMTDYEVLAPRKGFTYHRAQLVPLEPWQADRRLWKTSS